jgi:hypothetical protein
MESHLETVAGGARNKHGPPRDFFLCGRGCDRITAMQRRLCVPLRTDDDSRSWILMGFCDVVVQQNVLRLQSSPLQNLVGVAHMVRPIVH